MRHDDMPDDGRVNSKAFLVHLGAVRRVAASLERADISAVIHAATDAGGLIVRASVWPDAFDRAKDHLARKFGPSYGPVRIQLALQEPKPVPRKGRRPANSE